MAGGAVEDDVAARVAGGEERRLRRRLQRRPHDVLRQPRDLRRAVDAAAAPLQHVERALEREPHPDLGQRPQDGPLQPLDVGLARAPASAGAAGWGRSACVAPPRSLLVAARDATGPSAAASSASPPAGDAGPSAAFAGPAHGRGRRPYARRGGRGASRLARPVGAYRRAGALLQVLVARRQGRLSGWARRDGDVGDRRVPGCPRRAPPRCALQRALDGVRVGQLLVDLEDAELLGVLRLLLRQDVPQEALGAVVLGVEEDLARRALLDEVAVVHVHDAVGHVAAEAHLVADHDHGHAALGELPHDLEHLADQLGVEGAGRLVEEHEHRVHRHGAGDGDALLLAARELAGEEVHALAEPHLGEQLVRLADGFLLLHALHQDRALGDVLGGVLVREEVELLEDHAALHADLVHVLLEAAAVAAAGDVHVADPDLAGRGVLEEVQAAQEGALAGAGRPDEHDYLALVDLEVDALEHVVPAEVLLQALDLDDELAALVVGDRLMGVCLCSHATSPSPSRGPCRAPCASRAWPARS